MQKFNELKYERINYEDIKDKLPEDEEQDNQLAQSTLEGIVPEEGGEDIDE